MIAGVQSKIHIYVRDYIVRIISHTEQALLIGG